MDLNELVIQLEDRLSKWELGISHIRKGLNYLKKYGYLHSISQLTLEDIFEAVRHFQRLAGLVEDGEMGPKTLRAMSWPRCSLPDFYKGNDGLLHLDILKAKWGTTNLRYYIQQRDSDLPAGEWDEIIHKAFTQWSDVAGLNFSRSTNSSNANFILSVGSGSRDNFDGAGGTLAWAQLPPNNNYLGQLLSKFDTGETWVSNPNNRGILLLNVACHEIGHLLGLGHSSVQSALMAPFYNPVITKPQPNDDISRIVTLYPVTPGPTPDPTPSIPAPSNLRAVLVPDSTDSVRLDWVDNSTGEDGFEIYRNNIRQGVVGRGRTSAIDIRVPEGTHSYKIRAVLGNKYSDYSNEVIIVVGTPTPDPDPDPTPDDKLTINITGDIKDINIPGYRVSKIG